MTKVAHSSTTSTDTLPVRSPGASGHQAQLRPIDWNGHIPHAPRGPVSMTRAQVREQLAATNSDWDNKPILPPFPGQRRSLEQKPAPVPGQRTSAYDDVVLGFQYDGLAADAAFGGAA